MPRYDVRCTACGHEGEILARWDERAVPCAQCGSRTERLWRAAANVVTDTIIGGQVIETLDHEPMTFYSKQAIRDAADARGLRLVDTWAGPGDHYLSNWGAAIDAKTLDNARVLVERGSTTGGSREDAASIEVTTSVRILTQLSEAE